MSKKSISNSIFIILMLACAGLAQTTAFNYQGRLTDGGNPANGAFQMQFRLFDSLGGAGQVGSTITDVPVTATNGVFGAKLDFGANALNGANRWLEIAVRRNSGESYVTLAPREQIASSPYAVRTLSASIADNALNLGGFAANLFVQTSDPRLSDARNPLPGSANYIQNGTTLQPLSNFNISGNGQFGGRVLIGNSSSTRFKLNVQTSSLSAISGITTDIQEIGVLGSYEGTSGVGFGVFGGSASPDGYAGYFTGRGYFQGNVGIGTTNATARLSVLTPTAAAGDNTAFFVASNIGPNASHIHFGTTGDWYIRSAASSGKVILQDSGGFVGIGTNSPTLLLDVNGRARFRTIPLLPSAAQMCFDAAGDLLQCGASSLKWKTDIRPFNLGLDVVLRLRPINFTWKESGLFDFGLGAEDVAQIAPELTFTDEQGEVKGVKYDHLNVVFINAFKEQQQTIERQQQQIDALTKLVCQSKPRAEICKEK